MAAHGRITWETARDGGMTGYIPSKAHGLDIRITLFSIVFRPNPNDPRPYAVRHRLPFQQPERRFPTAKAAQEHAERYLVFALELMGFQPITPKEEQP